MSVSNHCSAGHVVTTCAAKTAASPVWVLNLSTLASKKGYSSTDVWLLLRQQGRRSQGGWNPLTYRTLKLKYLLLKELMATPPFQTFKTSTSLPCFPSALCRRGSATGLVLPLLPYRYNYNAATSDDNVSPERSNKQHRRCVCKHTLLLGSALASRGSLSQRRTLPPHRLVFGPIGGLVLTGIPHAAQQMTLPSLITPIICLENQFRLRSTSFFGDFKKK